METPRNSDPFESIIGTEDLQLLLPVMRKLAPCDNQVESKTLSELYAGVLSRDWEKLLKALDRGEKRVTVYAPYENVCISRRREENHYDLCNTIFIGFSANKIMNWLENNCVGYFETKEDKDGN